MPSSQPNTNHRRKMLFVTFLFLLHKKTNDKHRIWKQGYAHSRCLQLLPLFTRLFFSTFLSFFASSFRQRTKFTFFFKHFTIYHYHFYTFLHHFRKDLGNVQIHVQNKLNLNQTMVFIRQILIMRLFHYKAILMQWSYLPKIHKIPRWTWSNETHTN